MGIPFYYRQIIIKDQSKLLCELVACDGLFLDFNSIIHSCAGAVVGKSSGSTDLNSAIFEEIWKHTMHLTTICKPREILYIAIDGVAPRSKIQQQRKRRYLSAYRNEIINKFKDANNMRYTKWDSNAITPGTVFMQELQDFLTAKIESTTADFKIVLSTCNEFGEGEQKIIDNLLPEKLNVIYGLDADLIMLGLCNQNKIYLMREETNFFANSQNVNSFKFLNIEQLKQSISKILYGVVDAAKADDTGPDLQYMYDYVFMCYLLGNDFLPNIVYLKIKNGAIDLICQLYKKSVKGHLIEIVDGKFKINYGNLIDFFEKVSSYEDVLMKETTDQFYSESVRRNIFTSKFDKFTYELDIYPSMNKFPLVINPVEDTTWRNSYYHHLFGSAEIVKNVCENYIEGLEWTMNYYFNREFDPNWYYKYNYAPCLSDVYKYLKCASMEDLVERFGVLGKKAEYKINPTVQLLMVLPISSKELVEPKYQKIICDLDYNCVQYYPCKFCLTTYMKSHLWECLPVLPNIDAEKIIQAYEKLSTM